MNLFPKEGNKLNFVTRSLMSRSLERLGQIVIVSGGQVAANGVEMPLKQLL